MCAQSPFSWTLLRRRNFNVALWRQSCAWRRCAVCENGFAAQNECDLLCSTNSEFADREVFVVLLFLNFGDILSETLQRLRAITQFCRWNWNSWWKSVRGNGDDELTFNLGVSITKRPLARFLKAVAVQQSAFPPVARKINSSCVSWRILLPQRNIAFG